jgi:hypothetical protein
MAPSCEEGSQPPSREAPFYKEMEAVMVHNGQAVLSDESAAEISSSPKNS